MLSPQHHRLPSLRIPPPCSPPSVTCSQAPATCRGLDATNGVTPSPKIPKPWCPQHHTVASRASPHVASFPACTSVQRWLPATATRSTWSASSPMPSSPHSFEPQHHPVPSVASTH